jgi:hypothetical protein
MTALTPFCARFIKAEIKDTGKISGPHTQTQEPKNNTEIIVLIGGKE